MAALSPTQYASPPTNYVGTTLFLGYILAALYLTFSISGSLYRQYDSVLSHPPDSKDEKLKAVKLARKQHVKIYAFLASISFGTLSYHMLLFLVQSYTKWSGSKSVSLKDLDGGKLVAWMLESSLFEEFARELVRDGPSAFWSQVGVVAMWFWNIWMARKARKYRFTQDLMTKYILLGQILPISFSATLFIIQLHLSAPELRQDSSSPAENEKAKEQQKRQPTPKQSSLNLPNILINICLLATPALRQHDLFIPLILLTRVFLLLPHSRRINLRESEVVKCITVSVGFIVANVALMRKGVGIREMMRGLWTAGEAVKALGWDAHVGALVFGVVGWAGGV